MVINFKSNLINILFYFFFLLVFVNGSIFIFDQLILLFQFIFVFSLIIFYFILNTKKEYSEIKNYSIKINKFKRENLIFSFIILLPITIFFLFNFYEENSYAGDTIIHIENSITYNYFLLSSIFELKSETKDISLFNLITSKLLTFILLLFFLFLFRKKISSKYKILIIITSIIFFSYLYTPRITYPTGLYTISLPFNVISLILNYSLVGGLRLANFLSIFFWLFFLRPLIIGKWPDYKIVFFSLIILINNQYIFLFTSSYLEAYCLILLLIALEVIIERKNYHIEKAIIIIAFASAFKQPVIFLIPFLYILKQPWRLNFTELRNFTLLTLIFTMPFAIYYYYSIVLGNWPRSTTIDITLFNSENIKYFINKINNRHGLLNIFLILPFIFYSIFLLNSLKKIFYFFILISSGLLLSLYLFLDFTSSPWIGYIRFNSYNEIILLFLFMYNAFNFKNNNYKYATIFVFIFFVILINFNNYKNFTFGEDSNRNFIIHEYAPIYLPIKSLLKDNIDAENYNKNDTIYVNVPSTSLFYNTTILNNNTENKLIFYTDYKKCECNKSYKYLVVTFLNQINENFNESSKYVFKRFDIGALSGIENIFTHLEIKNQCILQIENSCNNIIKKFDYKNNIIGISGIYENN